MIVYYLLLPKRQHTYFVRTGNGFRQYMIKYISNFTIVIDHLKCGTYTYLFRCVLYKGVLQKSCVKTYGVTAPVVSVCAPLPKIITVLAEAKDNIQSFFNSLLMQLAKNIVYISTYSKNRRRCRFFPFKL